MPTDGHKYCGSGNIMVLVGHMILEDHEVKRFFDFMCRSSSSYHPATFGDHIHSGSEDIMSQVGLVISQEHMIKGSRDFICESLCGMSPPCQVW